MTERTFDLLATAKGGQHGEVMRVESWVPD